MSTDAVEATKAKMPDKLEPTKGKSHDSDKKVDNKVSISK